MAVQTPRPGITKNYKMLVLLGLKTWFNFYEGRRLKSLKIAKSWFYLV